MYWKYVHLTIFADEIQSSLLWDICPINVESLINKLCAWDLERFRYRLINIDCHGFDLWYHLSNKKRCTYIIRKLGTALNGDVSDKSSPRGVTSSISIGNRLWDHYHGWTLLKNLEKHSFWFRNINFDCAFQGIFTLNNHLMILSEITSNYGQ